MTANQLAYLGLQETKRNNIVVSDETKRANLAREGLQDYANKEQNRHNLVSEAQEGQKIAETGRHNLVTEKETNRSNLANESIQRGVAQEQVRHNKATERQTDTVNAETKRHNKANEKQAKYNTDKTTATQKSVAKTQAATQKSVAKTSADATKTAAKTSANATRYSADVQKVISDSRISADKLINNAKNYTSQSIAQAQIDAKKWIAKLDKQTATLDRNSADYRAYQQRKNELQKTLLQNKSQEKREWIKSVTSAVNNLINWIPNMIPG